MLGLVNNIAASSPEVSSGFFSQYFLNILQDIFFILTDSEHKSSFKGQSMLLSRLFSLVESNQIQTPLWDTSAVQDPSMTNSKFLRTYSVDLLRNAFPNMRVYVFPPECVADLRGMKLSLSSPLNRADIQTFVNGLCDLNQDQAKFKANLRDFLVSMREFSGDSSDGLFLDDKEAEQQRAKDEERAKAQAVPGMLKPSEQYVPLYLNK